MDRVRWLRMLTSTAMFLTLATSTSLAETRHSESVPIHQLATDRQKVVSYAKRYLGTPYRWGGESPHGFDCSGLVKAVYAHFQIELPRLASDQRKAGLHVARQALRPGDLVFFNTDGSPNSHVGIYIGDNEFISATSSHGVTICSLDNPYYWGPRYTGATNPFVQSV